MVDHNLKCSECQMTFKSPLLLSKHREKFCVGGALGDPHALRVRNDKRTDKHYTYDKVPITPEVKIVSPHYDYWRDAKIWNMAENHGKNMANLSAQNASLEKQKNDIRRRLMELSGAPPARPDPTSQLLDDIKETETKTQRTLEELKAQLKSLEDKGKKKSLPAPVVYNAGNSLVSEVRSLRQNYLHVGGNDPGILAQLSDMIAEAQALEDKQKNIKPPQKSKPATVSPQAEALELENARIQRELLLLQEKRASQALYDQHSQKGDFERQLQRLEQDHSCKMGELQQEIERLKQQGELERYKRELAEEVARQNEAKSLPVQMVSPQGVPVSYLPAKPIAPYEIEPLGAAPYDPHNGFVIFYDFVRGLPVGCLSARLVVGLYDSQVRVGEAAILPPVNTESVRGQNYTYSSYGALIGAKQPVPRCQPQADLGIVVELQLTSPSPSVVDPHRLASHAWTKLSLFDEYGQLTTGRFSVPFRSLPISPLLPVRDLERLQRFGEACLFYRIVHARDALKESCSPVGFQFTPSYRHPPMEEYFESVVPPLLLRRSPDPPPPPSATPPPSTPGGPEPSPRKSPVRPATSERRIGFQVDRVKGAESGQAKVRLTAYHASTGKVVYSDTSPVTCSTTAVHSNFKHRSHVFGQQEAVFDGAELKGDVVVIVRFYLHKREYRMDGKDHHLFDADPSQEETLVAWAAMPLVAVSQYGSMTSRSRRGYDRGHMQVKTGTHTLRLYRPPVVDPSRVPTQPSQQPRDWVRYRAATVRFHVFQGSPRPGSLTPSEASDDEDSAPQSCWIPLERRVAPSEPYTSGDGFDIYVDGCRYLPDSVTFSRVALRVMDRRYRMYGPDVVTGVHLDSDIYNPVYEHKEEIRDPEVPPTATVVFKVYTIDKYYRELTCVGYSILNVFVESGTERQPSADSGVQVSLNEGAHQLRLYQKGPDGADPLTEGCLRESRTRYIPCASLLVRLVKAPRGNNGRPLEASRVDESDWLRLGVWQPRPPYSDGVYYSEKCQPTRGENEMFGSMVKRPLVTMRQIVSTVAQANDSFLSSDKNLAQYIRNQLTRVADSKPLDQDMTPICVYNPKHGLKIAVDGACNIPWVNFTQASVCLNPPGAFYMGSPHATYDKLRFTEHLDLSSSHTAPVWLDGFKHFPNRSHHKYLVWIIHLQEVAVTVDKQNYKYGLLDQAWTAVQVFSGEHAVSMLCQLPLIKGAPKPEMLSQLTREPCKAWLERGITNNTIQLLKGCSVFVRLCDARRDEELPEDVPEKGKLEVNLDYIPPQLESEYTLRREGKTLDKLVPPGKSLQDFASTLAVKFKSLVYKLYEEGNATS